MLKVKDNLTSNTSDWNANEQLPKQLMVRFEEIFNGKYYQVRVMLNGMQVGDIVDDNSFIDDGYRYHDVFHYTFATLLEWSPCSRSMLKRKRKSIEDIDRIEDGARAAITEEAISLMIFNNAVNNDYFYKRSNIDDSLLTIIKNMVEPFEVRTKSKSDWEKAILKSYELFRHLRKNKGGIINFNLENKNIIYKKLN
ncbi:nucleotide pyrophosphohydrolase [Flavobacterium lipolyticum]|uniref:Nucleotide pyrophosphohydrolase n=1 Tax=Flavobacterium lipolyticum TaxID=2893754 RepID=A0ABS8M243_9FLAO|nr:nucleotide pyrophosphohydrolase [Flavobacterium sp. F-126]MCC9018903.1 nucleotide pyrophosphohydrolase [Flavobacterium sp. F-126]